MPSDSYAATSFLARCGYSVLENGEYERLREMCSDWVYARNHIRSCNNCGAAGDEDDGYFVNPGICEWWCADCLAAITPEEYEEQFRSEHPGVSAMAELGRKIMGEN